MLLNLHPSVTKSAGRSRASEPSSRLGGCYDLGPLYSCCHWREGPVLGPALSRGWGPGTPLLLQQIPRDVCAAWGPVRGVFFGVKSV